MTKHKTLTWEQVQAYAERNGVKDEATLRDDSGYYIMGASRCDGQLILRLAFWEGAVTWAEFRQLAKAAGAAGTDELVFGETIITDPAPVIDLGTAEDDDDGNDVFILQRG